MYSMEFEDIFSRAFWNEVNDLEISNDPIELNLEWTQSTESFPNEIQNIFIIENFKSTLMKATVLKDYHLHCKEKTVNISIYCKDKNVVCLCEGGNLSLTGVTVQLLSKWLDKAENVVTVQIQSEAFYKSEKIQNDSIFIRGINSKFKDVHELIAPNFIMGISAGVSNWRYLQKLNVSSYILYTNLTELDEPSIAIILNFFKRLGFHCDDISTYKPDFSNLYT